MRVPRDLSRPLLQAPAPGARRFSGARYRQGILAGLVASLALAIVVVNLPLYQPRAVYWYPIPTRERLTLEMLAEEHGRAGADVPVTSLPAPAAVALPARREAGTGGATSRAAEAPPPPPARTPVSDRMVGQRVLEFAEMMPEIEGGLRNYYIHIDYPPEAAAAGIEGRLMLEFVVEPDGSTSHVRVLQSLHPLCDSAAVRALRQTRFIPGRQNGVKTRVRMRLPVRFRLVDAR